MDKAVLRNFAIESRRDLMEKIDRKIKLFYVDEEFKKDNRGDVIVLSNDKHTLTLTKEEDINRYKLLRRIVELGYEQVVEEAAYTWFNRLVAIRYMEIHDFLPFSKDNKSLGINVLSSKENEPIPEIMKFTVLSNQDLDLDINTKIFANLKNDDEKFKYILRAVCKKISGVIPQVFSGVTDYIDILIPDGLLSDNGFVNKLIKNIKISDFQDIEIIGWLYQFYNSEIKDETFLKLQKNIKIDKEHIPAATQLFTPDWIVKYLVENSLGKLWLSAYPNSKIRNQLKYYLENEKEKESVCSNSFSIKDIKVLDPCMGSGHILIYSFKLLVEMYLELGWTLSDAVNSIIENNIYGLDIDDRASQLASFAITMVARTYSKKYININKMNVLSIQDSSFLNDELIEYVSDGDSIINDELNHLKNSFIDAKEYGSIIVPQITNYELLEERLKKLEEKGISNIFEYAYHSQFEQLRALIKQYKILTSKYEVVVTNPPYMGSGGMDLKLTTYLKNKYPNSKSDLFAVFMERCSFLTKEEYYYSMITQQSWMFLESFHDLREKIISSETIENMIHLGSGAFKGIIGAVTTAFIIRKIHSDSYNGVFLRLVNYDDENQKQTELLKRNDSNVFYATNKKFKETPNNLISYWISDSFLSNFEKKSIEDYADTKKGIMSGNNKLFVRSWFEVDINKIGFHLSSAEEVFKSSFKWFPITSGGPRIKWYGNLNDVVNLENEAYEITHLKDNNYRLRDNKYYCNESGSWSEIGGNQFSVRYIPTGISFGNGGPCCFSKDHLLYIIGFLNSIVAKEYLFLLAPTVNFGPDQIKRLPLIIDESKYDEIKKICIENINLAKKDWDSFEISWNFELHPFLEFRSKNNSPHNDRIEDIYKSWEMNCNDRFIQLKNNEERINDIFINIYKLNNELKSSINTKDITIRNADKSREIKSLISYAVGCMFGRYSLDEDGLIYAGGKFDKSRYKSFLADEDNIIPISDNDNIYYNDDIVGKFIEFIRIAFGTNTLKDNIDYIAEVLGKRGTESSEETIRRYFVNDFYNDHLKIYKKKPLYWMFDSGKKNGLKCLIYLHRYDEQIVSKIRTKYLHNTISIYQRTIEEIDYKLSNDELSTTDKRELQNKKLDLNGKITECNEYDEMVGNVANKMIKLDLDDGVAVNYSKFVDDNGKSILAKIK